MIIFFIAFKNIEIFHINSINNKQKNSDIQKERKFNAEEFILNVYNHKDEKIIKFFMEDYLVGVLASEMPADFSIEALKAQAVAARSYAYGRMTNVYKSNHSNDIADVCTNSAHCQAWIGKDEFLDKYEDATLAVKHWERFEIAVNQTRGIIIKYEGKVANPLYHSSSSNLTENSDNVWDNVEVPYLQSVVSLGDDLGYNYIEKKELSLKDFLLKLNIPGFENDENLDLKINYETSDSGRVKNIALLGEEFSGTKLRTLLGLKSTNFKIDINNKNVIIRTSGFGHGVGMSQWGANYLALNKSSFHEILKHYYSGISLDTIY